MKDFCTTLCIEKLINQHINNFIILNNSIIGRLKFVFILSYPM